jgi:chromosome segregation ATPase
MKTFLENLLIVFALALCGLNAYQWKQDAYLRGQVLSLHDTLDKKAETVRGLQRAVEHKDAEIQRLDGLRNELTATVKTNREEILKLTKASEKLEKDLETEKKQVEVYKEALDKANANIKKQNDDIKRQNTELKELAEERNAVVLKFNKLAEDYNKLVQDFNKLQEDFSKATNPNPQKEKK